MVSGGELGGIRGQTRGFNLCDFASSSGMVKVSVEELFTAFK